MKIYTYGYRSGDKQRLFGLMSQEGTVLIDIRLKPFSRIPGVNKSHFAARFGQKYMHCPDLGNVNYKGGPVLLGNETRGLNTVLELMTQQAKTPILMCCCDCYDQCHRSHVTKLLLGSFQAAGLGAVEHVELIQPAQIQLAQRKVPTLF